jgi:nucleotide-binding universal stress UspA family protein
VPVDGSNLSEEALGPAAELAEMLGADLLLLRVVEPPVAVLGDATFASFRPDEELAAAEQYLEGVAGRLRAEGRTVAARAAVGFASWEIGRAARDEGVDAIAMATHGRGGMARLVLGSVATLTLQRTPVPLLLARPAAVARAMAGPTTAAEPEPVGPPVSVTLDAREQQLVREGLELLLSSSERQEHLADPLHGLLYKLNQARAGATGESDTAPG